MGKYHNIQTLITVLAVGFFSSCGNDTASSKRSKLTSSAVTVQASSCSIESDQEGTFFARWKNGPLPIAFQQGGFSLQEKQIIAQAAEKWNQVLKTVSGIPQAFDYGNAQNPRESNTAYDPAFCQNQNQSLVDSSFRLNGKPMMIYKIMSGWTSLGSSHVPEAMALTPYCIVGSSPQAAFYSVRLEFNFENFWNAQSMPDLYSIALHEFGHVLGLDHSCMPGSQQSDFANCSNAPSSYLLASMYPEFRFFGKYGEVRNQLNENDQCRADYWLGN